ncbi:hypothetical protein [Streptomyces sp. NBC_00448]|uniref:hypothetical protein n=1 Tax=Streptomyces sp. NBC_00448 TaxID=2903652 RepID=UPI002E200307
MRDLATAPGSSGFGAYAVELGVRRSAATAEWARWAAELLEAEAKDAGSGRPWTPDGDAHPSRAPDGAAHPS